MPKRLGDVRIEGPRVTPRSGWVRYTLRGRGLSRIHWQVANGGPRHRGKSWTINVRDLRGREQRLPGRVSIVVVALRNDGCRTERVGVTIGVKNRDPDVVRP